MYPKEMNQSARDLLSYLKVIMGKDNVALAPVSEIQERMDMSTASIARGKAQLLEMDFIRQKFPHAYMVNPGHCCKARDERQAVYDAYSHLPHKVKAKE